MFSGDCVHHLLNAVLVGQGAGHGASEKGQAVQGLFSNRPFQRYKRVVVHCKLPRACSSRHSSLYPPGDLRLLPLLNKSTERPQVVQGLLTLDAVFTASIL